MDYLSRQRVSGMHVTLSILRQLPTVRPVVLSKPAPWDTSTSTYNWMLTRSLELTFTAWKLQPFANDCGYDGPPFVWDEERRFQIRCELDAAYFHLYGIAREDVDYIMETFPIVKRKDEEKYNSDFRTKRMILEVYDATAEATKTGKVYQTLLDPPPADPRVAHKPKPPRAGQVQRGKVVAYLTLLLHAWKTPVTRYALEPSLIFMLNDKLRHAVLGQTSAAQIGPQTASGEIVKGLDVLLPALHTNGAIVLENIHGHRTIRLGTNAGSIDAAPQADLQRADEAVNATLMLGEDRAMTYLDAIGEARYDIVQA